MKIWRFYESKKSHDRVKSAPLPLFNIKEDNLQFNTDEAYLVMLMFKNGAENQNDLQNFPNALLKFLLSSDNLSPRGL